MLNAPPLSIRASVPLNLSRTNIFLLSMGTPSANTFQPATVSEPVPEAEKMKKPTLVSEIKTVSAIETNIEEGRLHSGIGINEGGLPLGAETLKKLDVPNNEDELKDMSVPNAANPKKRARPSEMEEDKSSPLLNVSMSEQLIANLYPTEITGTPAPSAKKRSKHNPIKKGTTLKPPKVPKEKKKSRIDIVSQEIDTKLSAVKFNILYADRSLRGVPGVSIRSYTDKSDPNTKDTLAAFRALAEGIRRKVVDEDRKP